jgi:hypothetical protein
MAASSSTSTTINLMPVSEKLLCSNHTLWKAQVLTALRGAQLVGFLDGTNTAPTEKLSVKAQKGTDGDSEEVPNPDYETWKAQEQHVLSYLLYSMSCDVLIQVVVLPTASDVWKHIETSYASHSQARVINIHMALATTQKGSMTAVEYVSKMKSLVNDMASAGKKLDDEELSSYILASIDSEYNSLVSSIAARVEPISLNELYSQLLSFETRLEPQSQGTGGSVQSSANNAMRGHGGFTRGRGGRGGRGDSSYKAGNKFLPCQLCGRTNHAMFKCYKRFDSTFMGEEKSTNTANSYGVDSNWYADFRATDYVTGDLEKLSMKEPYNDNYQIYTASDSSMHIKHIGRFVISTPYRDLDLYRVIYAPHSSKNHASIHHITSDNNIFFELHPDFFSYQGSGVEENNSTR